MYHTLSRRSHNTIKRADFWVFDGSSACGRRYAGTGDSRGRLVHSYHVGFPREDRLVSSCFDIFPRSATRIVLHYEHQ